MSIRHAGHGLLMLGTLSAALGGCSDRAAGPQAATIPLDRSLFTADGFRKAQFRSPVTRDPDPARQIALESAMAMDPGHDALFIDVLPVQTGMRDPDTGEWHIADEHYTIPGAVWHPETGRAPVEMDLWLGLVRSATAARKARPDLPVVLFCKVDCWMAWNAARRLALQGFDNVYWLAEGVEGWHDAGGTLVRAEPVTISLGKVIGKESR